MFGKSKDTSVTTDARTKIGTLIGEGAVFNGNLTAPETIRVDGTVNGNCTCEKEVIIGAAGFIDGNISAQSIVISGKVIGDIAVNGKLELLSTGQISGNITAKSLVIDENASFDGRCIMTSSVNAAPAIADNSGNNPPAEAKGPEEVEKTASDAPSRDFVRISAETVEETDNDKAEETAEAAPAPARPRAARAVRTGGTQNS
ncbi:MAG: polymer-forming cytoskeletal protein [Clostridium sp.]|nr:polymer-forming cytoskeletal protein [Clostridium sp.]